jgi:hypothetical protein
MVGEGKPAGSRPEQSVRKHLEWLLDEALGATFPASDPVAITAERHRDGVAGDTAREK